MKVLFLAVAISAAFVWKTPKTDRIMKTAETMNFGEEEISRLRAASADFEFAERKLQEILLMMGLYSRPTNRITIKADVTDPTIRQLKQQWQKSKNRFAIVNKTVRRFGPSTNLMARAASATMQQKLDGARRERDEAKAEAKRAKELEKAAIKFGKNIDKVRKDFEKYRNKAATEEERAFWQALLDILPVPNEDNE